METRTIAVNGHDVRVWELGNGAPMVFLAGFMGLPQPIALLEQLADGHRVIVPSLPGFPGAEGHAELDTLSDWTAATIEILEHVTDGPTDVIASSVSAPLALEAAAMNRDLIRRLVLIGPFGTFDPDNPGADPWAQPPGPDTYPNLLCTHPESFRQLWTAPDGYDEVEWQIIQVRAREAAARYLWPLGDTGILRRAYRVRQPTLLIRGSEDTLIPAGYLESLRDAVGGDAAIVTIPGAGHLVEIDAPDALAGAINQFLD